MEVMIPPWVLPESPETLRWLDDATTPFPPAFGRGMTQRGIWADPRWGLRRRYRGLRSDQQAAILSALSETRGQFNVLRVTPHTPLRGSFTSSELLANSTFANGITGISATNITATVGDRVLRATKSQGGTGTDAIQTASVTANVPYAVRVSFRRPSNPLSVLNVFTDDTVLQSSTALSVGQSGLATIARVPAATSLTCDAYDSYAGGMAGEFWETDFMSVARCALIDNGPNLLLQSDTLATTWVVAKVTISSNNDVAPDGTTTADALVEDNTSGAHQISQTITVPAAVADYTFSVAVKKKNRNFAYLQFIENTGSTTAYRLFDVSGGAVGTTNSTGANFANARQSISNLGNGWFQISLTVRKTNAATSLTFIIGANSADSAASYLGNSSSAITCWRATAAQSSVATRLVQSVASAVPATAQIGAALYLKGLPASTTGLLESGDWIEVANQLKRVTSRLNSDANGLGLLQFRPGLADSPADNDPLIVFQPFGRFIYPAGTRELENSFGIYGDCEMNLEEIYS